MTIGVTQQEKKKTSILFLHSFSNEDEDMSHMVESSHRTIEIPLHSGDVG